MPTQVCSPTRLLSSPTEAKSILSDLLKIADAATLSGNKARAVEAISAVMAYAADIEERARTPDSYSWR